MHPAYRKAVSGFALCYLVIRLERHDPGKYWRAFAAFMRHGGPWRTGESWPRYINS